MRTALEGAALVYFDGRLAEAAALLAAAARERDIPTIVEGERLRPGLDDLLAGADYVTTSAKFPQVRRVLELTVSGDCSRVWQGRLRCWQQPCAIRASPFIVKGERLEPGLGKPLAGVKCVTTSASFRR